jgi:hypothetical protein
MGIDLYCEDVTFGCSYSGWNSIRIDIIMATIDYILDKYNKDKELYGHLTDNNDGFIGEGSTYYMYMCDLLKLKTAVLEKKVYRTILELDIKIEIPNDDYINKFINVCNLNYINALNRFNIGGLYALCNQSDCEGYYTPGNSLDICQLFDIIEPFVKKYSSTHSCIYDTDNAIENTIYEVFEHSYKTLKNVKIC